MFSTLHKTIFKFSVTFILSSANAFDLDEPKFLAFRNELTLYYTIQTFNDPEEKGFGKHWEKECYEPGVTRK